MASLSGAKSMQYLCLNIVGVMGLVLDSFASCERWVFS